MEYDSNCPTQDHHPHIITQRADHTGNDGNMGCGAFRIEEYEDNKENATILVDFEQSTKLSIQDENMMNMARSKGLRIVFPGRCRKRVGRRAAGQGPATKATLHRLSFLTDLEIESTIMERNTPNDSEELSLRPWCWLHQSSATFALWSNSSRAVRKLWTNSAVQIGARAGVRERNRTPPPPAIKGAKEQQKQDCMACL